MNRTNIFFIAMLLLSSGLAHAESGITLPLSRYGALVSPHLETSALVPPVRKIVDAAIVAAGHANRAASAAEDVIHAVMKPGEGADERGLDVTVHNDACRYRGETMGGHATGLGVMRCKDRVFVGHFRDGRLSGLGGDYALNTEDAYEGNYRDGARMGFGIERDKDGVYPGQYGFRGKVDMEIQGLQNFKDAHWAGGYGFYSGPKIACTLIKGAMLEGSVLDGYGAKFDSNGHLLEQGFYTSGRPQNSSAPPC